MVNMARSGSAYRSVLRTVLLSAILLCSAVQVQSCPEDCFCIATLVYCVFEHSQMHTVPTGIPPTTTILQVRKQQIEQLDGDSFQGLVNLQSLVLSDNKIRFISSFAFQDLHNLTTLYLNSNDLEEIQPYTFQMLSSLERLSLQDNHISRTSKHSFAGLMSLNTLDLENNELQEMPQEVIKPMEFLESLDMRGNPLTCTCHMAWMVQYYPELGPSPTCSFPPSLEGMLVSELEIQDLDCVLPAVSLATESVVAHKGEQVILTCTSLGGNPPPMLRWEFEGKTVEDSLDYRTYDNGTMVIVSLFKGLDGPYTCVGDNVMGSASAEVTVVYGGAQLPVLLTTPTSMHVFIGESFMLECSAGSSVSTYYWLKGGEELVGGDRVMVEEGVGLTVLNALQNDSGVYECFAVNEEGKTSAKAVVNVTGDLLSCNGVISEESVEELKDQIDFAVNVTTKNLNATSSPSSLLRKLKFPPKGVIELTKAAEVFESALELAYKMLESVNATGISGVPSLTPCELTILAELSGCAEHSPHVNCSDTCFHLKYRTVDGTCNNFDNPLAGAAATPFKRLLEPAYEDGIGQPVGWSTPKPSARNISSTLLHSKTVNSSVVYTHMLMQFGQFLDHDLDLAPVTPSDVVFSGGGSCDSVCTNDPPCFPIPVPEDDARIEKECIPFTRSSAVCGSGGASLLTGKAAVRREQINAITAFMDASQVYGSDQDTASKLREDGGRLRVGLESNTGKYLLPFDNYSLVACDTGRDHSECFLAGDGRANEQVGLTSMHTIFFREHNRLAEELSGLNPHWDGEKVYQEARKVLIAEWQNIVFTEYLPKILGPVGMSVVGPYEGYRPTVNPSIANAFATAAYRFGHSQIMPLFERLGENYAPLDVGPLKLRDAFFAPFRILEEGGVDPLIRGLIASPVKLRDSSQGLNSNLTEALFAQVNKVALDLASLNIQRGRDHGLPGYNLWRAYCGLQPATKVEDLEGEIGSATVREKLVDLYGDDPDDIDLWVGGLLEDVLPGGQLGPTFMCIIAEQFKSLRDGDRLWYEHPSVFTPDQLLQIRKASLSRIICDNADSINKVPKDAFVLQEVGKFVDCNSLPSVNLDLWKECQDGCVCGSILSQLLERVQHLEDNLLSSS